MGRARETCRVRSRRIGRRHCSEDHGVDQAGCAAGISKGGSVVVIVVLAAISAA